MVNTAWSTLPPLVTHTPAPEEAVYIWDGPYDTGEEFTVVYEVVVPVDAEEGTYAFPNGLLEYYVGDQGPFTTGITGHTQLAVFERAATGFTGEVCCDILPEVTITLYRDGVWLGETVSDQGGYYMLPLPGTDHYEVTASKDGFRPETRWLTVTDLEEQYELHFIGNQGLVPDADLGAGAMDYFLHCMNLYLEDWGECSIDMDKFLAIMNAYLEVW